MYDKDNYQWKVPNFDFEFLYPTIMKTFDISDNETLMKIIRDRQRSKQLKERREKLERLNNLYEKK